MAGRPPSCRSARRLRRALLRSSRELRCTRSAATRHPSAASAGTQPARLQDAHCVAKRVTPPTHPADLRGTDGCATPHPRGRQDPAATCGGAAQRSRGGPGGRFQSPPEPLTRDLLGRGVKRPPLFPPSYNSGLARCSRAKLRVVIRN